MMGEIHFRVGSVYKLSLPPWLPFPVKYGNDHVCLAGRLESSWFSMQTEPFITASCFSSLSVYVDISRESYGLPCNDFQTIPRPFNFISFCFGAHGGSETDDTARIYPQVPVTKSQPSLPGLQM